MVRFFKKTVKKPALTTDVIFSFHFFQRPIVNPRFRAGGGGSDHQIKIMYQPSTPYHLDLQKKEELAKQKTGSPATAISAGAVGGSPGGGLGSPTPYKCHICGFAATRLNVIIACQKKCRQVQKDLIQQLAQMTVCLKYIEFLKELEISKNKFL